MKEFDTSRPSYATSVSELAKLQQTPEFVLFGDRHTDDGPSLYPVFFFNVEALQEWIADKQRYGTATFKVYALSGAQVSIRTVVEVKT